jgi:cytosine/adenosine deaminase-related metal-dependent hydrolase
MSPPSTLLRARLLLPITGPVIEDGALLVEGPRIAAVDRFASLKPCHSGPTVDLGDVILLPGLINPHCHLDYTDMTGLSAPRHFADWIKALLALKAAASYTEYAASWLRGSEMLLRTGTTTVGDIEAVPELIPEVWSSTPLRVLSFLELTGVKSRRDPAEILREAAAKLDSLPQGRCWAGLSPHALYSTSPALLEAAAALAAARNWRVTMHLAESLEESAMYAHRSGALFDWLGAQRDMSDCGGRSCVQQAARCGLLRENFLAVHCNYVSAQDAALLGAAGASVVHCPRSHAYFGHAPFPYHDFTKSKTNVCLGTDSLASVAKPRGASLELSLFAEMRQFAAVHPEVTPPAILEMTTINAARALGRAGQIGCLSPGALADVIAVPLAANARDVYDALVHDATHVAAAMIDGRWAIAPPAAA